MRTKDKGKSWVESAADYHRLIQELQIHQIELELQNEDLKQTKAEADANLERFTELFDFAPVGYFSILENGTILEVNLTGAELFGIERSRLVGRRFKLFVTPSRRAVFQEFLDKMFAGQENQACEATFVKGNGLQFWGSVEGRSATAAEGANKWCRIAVVDISARKHAEEAQRRIDILAETNRRMEVEIERRSAVEAALKKSEQALRHRSHQILLAQEQQRKEISRALHDEISQLLLGIGVHLDVFMAKAATTPVDILKNVAPLRKLVAKSLDIVHQFARDLRPEMLDDLGLIPALQSYLGDFSKRTGLRIRFTAFAGDEGLGNDERTVLYRIAQEALMNVRKHANAKVVYITLTKAGGSVALEIADDGKAFDISRISSPAWSNHLGLMGMKERVMMVGGQFSVVSNRGSGTIVRAEVPLRAETQRDRRLDAKRSKRRNLEFAN